MDNTYGKEPQQKLDQPAYGDFQRLGDYHTSLGNFEQAESCYEKAARLGPDESGPYLGLGAIALKQHRLDDAELAFRVAVRLDPNCSGAYCGLAMTAHKRQDNPLAFELYLKSLELDTDNLTALLGLFQASCLMGSFAKVIEYLEIYLDAHPLDGSVMFSLATLYMREERLFQAKKLLNRLLEIEPENTDAADLLEEIEHKIAQKKICVVPQ